MNIGLMGRLAGLVMIVAAGTFTWNSANAADGDGIVPVGAGSYTSKLPAGAKHPSYTQYKTENVKGPVPLSQWWSAQMCWPLTASSPLYGHPLAVCYDPQGMRVYYPGPAIHADEHAIWGEMWNETTDLRIGLAGVNAYTESRVDGYSDWFISVVSKGGNKSIKTSYGHGSPFVFATTDGTDASVALVGWPQVFAGGPNDAVLGITVNGRHYGIFGPTGCKWTGMEKFPNIKATERAENEKNVVASVDGGPKFAVPSFAITSNLNGKKYFSVALLPDNTAATLALYQRYAYNFVTDTSVEWKYEKPGAIRTTFSYTVDPMEGNGTETVFAMYPHQWKWRDVKSPLKDLTYASVRGTMKVGVGSSFETVIPIQGVLPQFPAASITNKEGEAAAIKAAARLSEKSEPEKVGDTYAEGKHLGKLAMWSEEAEALGDLDSQKIFISELKARLQLWFTATPEKKRQVFYYDATFGTMIGYPGGYGSDVNLNDHHFHYGYFIRAAAEVARVDPAWAKQWGGMVNMLIRDIATSKRDDKMFPPFRSFDRYAGHSWASGDGHALDGCNQESSSEAMNAWYGMILWGQATGDMATRDLGLYIYNTEMTAVEEYWFDVSDSNFHKDYPNATVGMVWGGKGAHGTWFNGTEDWIQGINYMPYSPGSVYLGRYPEWIKKSNEYAIKKRGGNDYNTGVGDLLLMLHATEDPADALRTIASKRQTKFEGGNTEPFFLHWISTFDKYGKIDRTITSDYPMYTVFSKNGFTTYVIYNYSDKQLGVTFSNGVTVQAAPKGITVKQGN